MFTIVFVDGYFKFVPQITVGLLAHFVPDRQPCCVSLEGRHGIENCLDRGSDGVHDFSERGGAGAQMNLGVGGDLKVVRLWFGTRADAGHDG